MPFNYDPNLDPDQQNQQPGQGNTQLASGGQVAGGGSQTQAGSQNASQPYSGGFQNLQDYLSANQNDTTGQKFTSNLQGGIDEANKAQKDVSNQFKQQVDQSTVKEDKDTVDKAVSDPYGYLHPSQNQVSVPENQVSGVTANNQQSDIDQAAKNAFQGQLNAQYKGPQSLVDYQQGYQKAQGSTQKAADEAKAAQSEGGRFALLNNYFGQGGQNYSQGEKSLDNLLIQNNPQTQQAIQQSQQNASQSQGNFNQMVGNLGNYAAQGMAQTQAARDYARNALGIDATGQFGANSVPVSTVQQLQSQADAINAANQKAYQDKVTELSTMTGGYGVNALDYLHQDPAQATVANLATPDQVAKIQALSDLSGLSNTYLTDPSQAGTYNLNGPAYTYDQSGLANAIASAQAAWEQAHTNSRADTNNGQPVTQTVTPGYFGYSPIGTKGGLRMG